MQVYVNFVIALTMAAFAASSMGKPADARIIDRAAVVQTAREADTREADDALVCKIECNNGNTYTCWFCKCESLPPCSGSGQ